MADLIAIHRVTYAGRVHRPGVAFCARTAHARALVAKGRARVAPETVGVRPCGSGLADAPEPENVLCVDHGNDVEFLRATFEARTGRTPDKRWGAARLRKEMANS